jgi:arginyl-tRNA synthetase
LFLFLDGSHLVHVLVARVRAALAAHIRQHYQQDVTIVTEKPPRIEMGEVATPVCFELAKCLKRAPRQIAQEIAGKLPAIDGVERVEIAGGGYVNFYFSRAAFLADALKEVETPAAGAAPDAPKCIVEHTNINPNKAAHIGHLRNAVLGDTFVRLLRRAGQRVEVQNYIDNTGVQVADVVIGFLHLAKKTPAEVRALVAEPKFDYYCWDLYASVTHFFEEDKTRLALRGEMLKSIEEGTGEAAEMANIVAPAIVRCHLQTM